MNYLNLVPPPIAHMEEYRARRNARLTQGLDPSPLDPRAYDLASIAREWDRVADAAGHGDLDSAA